MILVPAGSKDNMCDLSGIRGLMMSTSGKVIEVPIRSSFRDGLSVIEYFIATRGGRKGMVDKALKTADAGYLTRRLVDVAQEVVVDDEDCFATLGEKLRVWTFLLFMMKTAWLNLSALVLLEDIQLMMYVIQKLAKLLFLQTQ